MLTKILMCSPDFYEVNYQINPWMKPGTTDPEKAFKQWNNLKTKYEENGLDVCVINQKSGLPDMVFAADQGLILNKHQEKIMLMSNFKYPERQGETSFYARWFLENGFKIEYLPQSLTFEGGGECLPFKDKFLIGHGFRNSSGAINYISQKYEVEFISLDLVDEKYYHLDTCLFKLDEETIFYYPPAFSEHSLVTLSSLFPNMYKFTQAEVEGFCANSVVSGNQVYIQTGNSTFQKKLTDLNYEVIEIDVSEFIKAGGGIHCLTFELERQPHFAIQIPKTQTFKIKKTDETD